MSSGKVNSEFIISVPNFYSSPSKGCVPDNLNIKYNFTNNT
jgi:hypothetical protein